MTKRASQAKTNGATENAMREIAQVFDGAAAETIAARNRVLVQKRGINRAVYVVGKDGEVKALITHADLEANLYARLGVEIEVQGRRPEKIVCEICKIVVTIPIRGVIPKRCRKCVQRNVSVLSRPSVIVCEDCGVDVNVDPLHGSVPHRCKRCKYRRCQRRAYAKNPEKYKAAKARCVAKNGDKYREQSREYMRAKRAKLKEKAAA